MELLGEEIIVFYELVHIKGGGGNVVERGKYVLVGQSASISELCKAVVKLLNLPDSTLSNMKVYLNNRQFQNNIECPMDWTLADLISAGASVKMPVVISVLDRILGACNFSTSPLPMLAFQEYQHVAVQLVDCDIVMSWKGSSGCGKSQLAMTLYHKSKVPSSLRKVYYFVCERFVDAATQKIYQYFKCPSELFMECIYQDFYSNNPPSQFRNDLINDKLYVFDFIRQLLFEDIYGKKLQVQVGQLEGVELYDMVKTRFDARNRPIVILDEFLPRNVNQDESNERLLNFIRNCFLAVGITVILMGTDAKVANMMQRNEFSRGEIDLPRKAQWFKILCNSRPLFALQAKKVLSQELDTDKVLRILFKKFLDYKGIGQAGNRVGQVGQVALTLNVCHTANKNQESTYLIHCHYGRLLLDQEPTVLLCNGMLQNSIDRSYWCPKSAFPSPEDDLLLHLVMLGGLGYRAIYRGVSECPLRVRLRDLLQDTEARTSLSLLDLKNAHQLSNDGQWLEVLLASAICLASRQGGVKGIRLKEFFKHLMFELHPKDIDFGDLTLRNDHLIDEFDHLLVPFYSAPGAQWPNYIIDSKEFNCRNWDRVVNGQMLDACGVLREVDWVDGGKQKTVLQAEAKCWSTQIRSDEMRKMLIIRINEDSDISLLVGTIFQKSYFQRESIAQFIREENLDLSQCKFLKLSQKNGVACFNYVDGLIDQIYSGEKRAADGQIVYKRLAVLIEIGNQL
ncbi:hypothetical protein MP228_000972 [Amoeboaphelidium protococcarum]|nr:hypothetical protein MP228_000972 [Amoeboaphelidium protococcarum]